jgi:GTP-binding protein
MLSPQGKTRTLNFFRVGAEPGRLVVVDAPGYGARGRPEWGELFDHYIDTRKEYALLLHDSAASR